MSSFPQHAGRWFVASSYILMLLGYPLWWISVIVGLISASLDLYALPETVNKIYTNLYVKSHQRKWWKYVIVPMGEHLESDNVTHKPGGGWHWWAYIVEGILDVAVVAFFVLYWSDVWLGVIVLFGMLMFYTALMLIMFKGRGV